MVVSLGHFLFFETFVTMALEVTTVGGFSTLTAGESSTLTSFGSGFGAKMLGG